MKGGGRQPLTPVEAMEAVVTAGTDRPEDVGGTPMFCNLACEVAGVDHRMREVSVEEARFLARGDAGLRSFAFGLVRRRVARGDLALHRVASAVLNRAVEPARRRPIPGDGPSKRTRPTVSAAPAIP